LAALVVKHLNISPETLCCSENWERLNVAFALKSFT